MKENAQPTLFAFDNAADFRTAKERYGTWPTTVWTLDHGSQLERAVKGLVGDGAEARKGAGTQGYRAIGSPDCGKVTESVFSPSVAAWALNMYAPAGGVCFDPFAGGGTRAIMAAAHGMNYVGIELRPEEVSAVRGRVEAAGFADSVVLHCADSCSLNGIMQDGVADFVLTCPPYWSLERYNGGPFDLSMIQDYGYFIHQLGRVIRHTYRILKSGSVSVWVVGLHRHSDGRLAPLHHDIASEHTKTGFVLREEIVLNHINTGNLQRVGQFEKGRNLLVRAHEYALIFNKP